MRTIFKYPLEIQDRQEVAMPAFANILCIQLQEGKPCLWAQVDSNAIPETRIIGIFGTGHPLPSNPMSYIGTFQIHSRGLVFHVYEIKTE